MESIVGRLKQAIDELKIIRSKSSITLIKPSEWKALTDIQKYNVFDRISKMEEKINTNIKNIEIVAQKAVDAAHTANLSKETALEAGRLSTTIYNSFINMSEGMRQDINTMIESEKNLMNVIRDQISLVSTSFNDFGEEIKYRATILGTGSEELIKQLEDAAREIQIPLNKVIAEAKAIRIPFFLDIFGIGRAIGHAISAFAHLTFAPYGGENSVLFECIEAFLQISDAFKRLKDGFTGFGGGVSEKADNLGSTIDKAMVEIKITLSEFMASFETVFTNMSYRMKVGEDTSQQIIEEREKKEAERQAEYEQWRSEVAS